MTTDPRPRNDRHPEKEKPRERDNEHPDPQEDRPNSDERISEREEEDARQETGLNVGGPTTPAK